MLPLTPSNTETSRHCAVVSLQKATSLTAGLLWRISALFSLLSATSVFMCPIHVCARVWKPENNLSWHSPGTFLLFRKSRLLVGGMHDTVHVWRSTILFFHPPRESGGIKSAGLAASAGPFHGLHLLFFTETGSD